MRLPSGQRARAAVLGWLPVGAVVTAVFAVPATTDAAAPQPLTVRPAANTYGGERLVISGDMGSGEQRIFLQRGAGGSVGSPVVDPRTGRDFTMLTQANGEFSFVFPAFAMDGLFIRVVSGRAVTEWHETHTIHQEAEVGLVEREPAEVPLPRGFAVVNEEFQISVDTLTTDRSRVLPGRLVTLERREAGGWTKVASARVGANGRLLFPAQTEQTVSTEVYRAVLQPWTQDGAQIGWFPSLPFYVEVVRRPDPVRGPLGAQATSSSVELSWTLPVDPDRSAIVIARTGPGGDPDPLQNDIATISGAAERYVDRSVNSGWSYRYAVYTRSKDGVYTKTAAETDVAVPRGGGEG